jgi:hypothetical protein
MRKIFALLAIITMVAYGCQNQKKMAEIRFCADILSSNPCVGEDTIFPQGRVWVQLLLKSELEDTAVIGKLYNLQNSKRILIGSIVHELDEGEKFIFEPLNMNISGKYEVEFVDTQGNLLAKKKVEIW